ncbi:MAG: hypothetical protein RBS16_09715 [Candidatus Cloacimonadales bacterium]|jgi:hypothetical protein|nr:hypothetical protein [Candidatus Cloacimonadota bacterium]MDD2650218.1 hypothetical protein [Candidatus Cloacimonadota bacterium]MDD3501540.1 hypothetical protein [Candidatus Cloacimonadota bacterium]MDX9978290.1 hypothetical protein [Candidatus Cloacimonadales bacterium]
MDRFKGDVDRENISTIYNYIILLNLEGLDIYGYSQIGYVGGTKLDIVAEEIYSELDEFVEKFIYLINQLYLE